MDPFERVVFFDGQMLSANDFAVEQQYQLSMRRLHNRMMHGWGVVSGLAVTLGTRGGSGTGSSVVQVSPGLALSPRGDVIRVVQPFAFDALLCGLNVFSDPCSHAITGAEGTATGDMWLVIRRAECFLGATVTASPDMRVGPSRARESYQVGCLREQPMVPAGWALEEALENEIASEAGTSTFDQVALAHLTVATKSAGGCSVTIAKHGRQVLQGSAARQPGE